MALFRKYSDGKDYLGGISPQESSKGIAYLLKKVFRAFVVMRGVVCDVHSRDSIYLIADNYTGNLDKVPPSSAVIEFQRIEIIDRDCFSVDSTTAAKEITIKKNGVYFVHFYCQLDTTFDGEYISCNITAKSLSPYGFNANQNYLGLETVSATGTASKGYLTLTGFATLHAGDILRVRTNTGSGSENGVKISSRDAFLSIMRIKPFRA